MYAKLKEGYDIVGTRRQNRQGEPLIRSMCSNLFYGLIKHLSDTEMVNGVRDYRLMTRQVVDSILELGEVNRFSKGSFRGLVIVSPILVLKTKNANMEKVVGIFGSCSDIL